MHERNPLRKLMLNKPNQTNKESASIPSGQILVSVRKLMFLHGGEKIGSSFYNIISDVVLLNIGGSGRRKIETDTELGQSRIALAIIQVVVFPPSFVLFVDTSPSP